MTLLLTQRYLRAGQCKTPTQYRSGFAVCATAMKTPRGKSGATVDERADVYSLGAILYAILTGQRPLEIGDRDVVGIIEQLRSHDITPPKLLNRQTPRDLEAICMKCLETDPAQRYATATELGEDLKRFAAGEPVSARPITVRRLVMRWARKEPGLAVTWLGILVFYAYHLTNWMVLDDIAIQRMHATATAVAGDWTYGLRRLVTRHPDSLWPIYGWVTMEIGLVTILASVDGADSGLVVLFPVLAAASILRSRTVIVTYVSVLSTSAYGFLVWLSLHSESALLEPLLYLPVGLATLCIGCIQYLTLRRYGASRSKTVG